MLAIISPAKKLGKSKKTSFKLSEIPFPEESKKLISELRKFTPEDISELMNISPKLAELNFKRYLEWNYPFDENNAGAALFMFNGDVYRSMNADDFSEQDILFAQKHLRILSGLYGILRPADKIMPYRLEAGTKLKINGSKNLYDFWGNKITKKLNEDLSALKNKVIVNLASNEYYKLIKPENINGKILKITFKQEKNGEYKVIAIHAKRARGLMCNFIIKNKITKPEDLQTFDYEQYNFNAGFSSDNEYVFTR
ncbi:MAG: peroxide stress protein YaaA [Chlorobi bacterium]|nr:peroxide stress protein YaaA [Chlorobiota bacterium]